MKIIKIQQRFVCFVLFFICYQTSWNLQCQHITRLQIRYEKIQQRFVYFVLFFICWNLQCQHITGLETGYDYNYLGNSTLETVGLALKDMPWTNERA